VGSLSKKHKFAAEGISQPQIQYMNIYQGTVKRLGCFQKITNEYEDMWRCQRAYHEGYELDSEITEEQQEELEGGYFYGDATSYEQHLDKALK